MSSEGREPGPRRGRRTTVVVGAFVVALLAGLGWLVWERPWRPHGEVGEVLRLDDGRVPSGQSYRVGEQQVEVATPGGVWTVTIGDPRDRMGRYDWVDADDEPGEERFAPRGANWVPIAWARTGSITPAGIRTLDIGDGETPTPVSELGEPGLRVVGADDETVAGPFELLERDGTPTTDGVAVLADDVGSLRVELIWGGHAQSVDVSGGEVDAGVAAPYYEEQAQQPPERADCEWTSDLPAEVVDELAAGRRCDAFVQRSPWSAAGGWVDSPEQTWLSVSVQVGLSDTVAVGEEVLGVEPTRGTEPSITLDGRPPQAQEELLGPDADLSRWWAPATWSVPSDGPGGDRVGPVVVEVPVVLEAGDGEEALRGTVSATVGVGPTGGS